MVSFEDFFSIYAYNTLSKFYLMDNLIERLNTSPAKSLTYLINLYVDTGPHRNTIYDAIPELYAYVIWIKIYLGYDVDIYTTDSLFLEADISEDDEPEYEMPKYMEEAFPNRQDMFNYVLTCAFYAISSRNILVLEKALEYEGVLNHLQHHFVLTKLMMGSNPDKSFLSYMKDRIFKNEAKINLTQYRFDEYQLKMLIDLDFRFLFTTSGVALSHVALEDWDLFFGLRDFPLFDDREIRAARVYYNNAGGDVSHFDSKIEYWRNVYKTPQRKIQILNKEETVRNVKMELNDLMYSYNSVLELGGDGDLLMRGLYNNIDETKLKLTKLEQELSSI